MKKILPLFIYLIFFGTAYSQTTITTNHSNNNGNGSVTFNVQNTNPYDILITDIQCHLGTSVVNNIQVMVNTNPIYDYAPPWDFGTIANGQNGWMLKGTSTVSSSSINGIVPAISGLEILIPAGATYAIGFSATTLQYMSLPNGAGTNTFTQNGVSILTGDGISWGGIVYPSTPANYPRGFIGGITFVPAVPCVAPPPVLTVSSNRNCTTDPISLSVPFAGINATFKWESSATGTNFTPIPNADARTFTTSLTSDTYFRCAVTCTGTTTYSSTYFAAIPKTEHITRTICNGTTLTVNGITYHNSGTHTQTLTAQNGCDSTLTIDLTILDPITRSLDTAICAGTALVIGGTSYTTAGTYTKVLTAENGCDSTLTINLSIKQPTSSTLTESACSYFTLNGTQYTSTGVYTQTLDNAAGCDSTITLNLTIKQPTSSSLTKTACSSYTLNGTAYTSSGVYTQKLTNAAGCDSTINLNLTINQPTTATLTRTACSSYSLNGTAYTSSGVYTQTLTNASGCDSTITLNLTITQPTSSTLTQTACFSYTLNGTIYNSSGVYTQTLANAAGCDSTITLNLQIETVENSVTQNGPSITANNNNAGVTYQWVDCTTGNNIPGATSQTFLATSDGSYKVVISKGNCSISSNCFTVNNVKAGIYPNPSKGAFAIRLGTIYQKIEIELFNLNGKLVLRRQATNTSSISINEPLIHGVYQARIHADGVVLNQRVVIVK